MKDSITRERTKQNRRHPAVQLGAVLFWLLLWQAASTAVGLPLLLPSPLRVLARLKELGSTWSFWETVLCSLRRILIGFATGVTAGALLAVAAWAIELVEALARPMLGVLKATPVASFIILALVWVESDALASLISFIMVLPVVYHNVREGLDAVDGQLLEMAHAFSLSRWKIVRCCYLPALVPFVLSALTSALGLAWKSGIAAEVLGRPVRAIGRQIYDAKIYLETEDLFAWTLVVILLSILLEKLVTALLGRLSRSRARRAKG
ncbi:MAG: ABC transporter permease subunit [Negativibacillus sp.]|nr:ABC transporter permease subunit [Negativibacillus sp.]